jgi:hypothetical protein
MPEDTKSVPVVEKELTQADLQVKIEDCAILLKRKERVDPAYAYLFSELIIGKLKRLSEVEEAVKFLQEKDTRSFVGITTKMGTKKHTHSYAVIVLNYGEHLVGVTTGTTGEKDHVHVISLSLDSRIISLEAYTNYQAIKIEKDGVTTMEDSHRHVFRANIEQITIEVPPIYVRTHYYSEDGISKEGNVLEALKQIKMEEPKEDSTMMSTIIPASETTDERAAISYRFSNQRQAHVLLNRVASLDVKPDWYSGDLSSLQSRVVTAVLSEHEDIDLESSNIVAEMCINLAAKRKLDPKAKVRNRGDVVFPAGSADVLDNKDHFPLGSISQARNALARAAQYSKSPPWYKGSLAALQQKVRRAVKKKYPSIKVTGLTEFFALRLKEIDSVHFIHVSTRNIDTAKKDAAIYFKECPATRVDLVKFVSTEDGESKFTELGRIVLYDKFGNGFSSHSNEVKLSDIGADGFLKIEVLREGKFIHDSYGDLDINRDKMEEIMKNFNDDVLDREVSFDANHMPALPAVAWVKKLSISQREIKSAKRYVLNAHVKPTKLGNDAIKNEEFKYFSAEYTDDFRDKETGKSYGTVLKGGGLTNRPWMPGLAPIELSEISENIGFINQTQN